MRYTLFSLSLRYTDFYTLCKNKYLLSATAKWLNTKFLNANNFIYDSQYWKSKHKVLTILNWTKKRAFKKFLITLDHKCELIMFLLGGMKVFWLDWIGDGPSFSGVPKHSTHLKYRISVVETFQMYNNNIKVFCSSLLLLKQVKKYFLNCTYRQVMTQVHVGKMAAATAVVDSLVKVIWEKSFIIASNDVSLRTFDYRSHKHWTWTFGKKFLYSFRFITVHVW